MGGMDAITRAIDAAGGTTKFAALIGVTPQFVWQMRTGVRPIPPRLCVRIESETGVRREELRPDIFGVAA